VNRPASAPPTAGKLWRKPKRTITQLTTLYAGLIFGEYYKSPYSGVRQKTYRVKQWRDGQMVLRWTALALLSIEKRMRRIMGYEQLWVLEAKLMDADGGQNLAEKGKVA
jgi:hypothetical protein